MGASECAFTSSTSFSGEQLRWDKQSLGEQNHIKQWIFPATTTPEEESLKYFALISFAFLTSSLAPSSVLGAILRVSVHTQVKSFERGFLSVCSQHSLQPIAILMGSWRKRQDVTSNSLLSTPFHYNQRSHDPHQWSTRPVWIKEEQEQQALPFSLWQPLETDVAIPIGSNYFYAEEGDRSINFPSATISGMLVWVVSLGHIFPWCSSMKWECAGGQGHFLPSGMSNLNSSKTHLQGIRNKLSKHLRRQERFSFSL